MWHALEQGPKGNAVPIASFPFMLHKRRRPLKTFKKDLRAAIEAPPAHHCLVDVRRLAHLKAEPQKFFFGVGLENRNPREP